MNQETERRLRAERLTQASHKVREESLRVNAKFEAIEMDPGCLNAEKSGWPISILAAAQSPGKTRPVLIVQPQALLDATHPSTLVVPLTTRVVDDAEPCAFESLAGKVA